MERVKTVLFFVMALCLSLHSEAAPREISFDCGDLLSGPPDRPLVALDALLEQNPRVSHFHLMWRTSGTLGGDRCWVFYDRKNQTLRLKHKGEYFVGDDDGPGARKRKAYSKAWRFGGVSRSRLHRLMRFYRNKPNADGSNVAFLSELPRFGCSMKIVQNVSRTFYPAS